MIGHFYESDLGYISIISLGMTLLSISFISLLQLQTIFRQDALKQHEQWETITWSTVHICFCILLLLDWIEMVNIIVIGLITGLIITLMIMVVGTCACYVIILNGKDWSSHVHLTCISFWIMAQYMQVRLPNEHLNYVTTVPVCLMAGLRLVELCEHRGTRLKYIMLEMSAWVTCIILHILCDTEQLSKISFLWGTFITIVVIVIINKEYHTFAFMTALPLINLFLMFYIGILWPSQGSFETTLQYLTKLYEKWTYTPRYMSEIVEITYSESDFDEPL